MVDEGIFLIEGWLLLNKTPFVIEVKIFLNIMVILELRVRLYYY